MRVLVKATLAAIALLAAISIIPAPRPAATQSDLTIDRNVEAALTKLYAGSDAARTLSTEAKAILVFPQVFKAGLLFGGHYGEGSLRQGPVTLGYYSTTAVSYGLQAGVQWYGYALFFMNTKALNYLYSSRGWEIGVGPSVVLVDQGVASSLTTTTVRSDVYAFTFNQQGLMAGLGLQGSKISQFTP